MLAGQSSGILYSVPLLAGDAGPEQTIGMLRHLVDQAWKDPVVNRTAIDTIRNAGVQPYDNWGQIRAIYNFAHSFYFVNDPVMKEALRPTRELLKLGAGDCDDINGNVLPALLGTIGYETRLVTIAADPEMPESFSHVYVEVLVDGIWYPLDAARPGVTMDSPAPSFFRRKWWSLTDNSSADYPADSPAGAMAGFARHMIRGMGQSSMPVMVDQYGNLVSVDGQSVQPVVGAAFGPGGSVEFQPQSGGQACGCGGGSGKVLLLIGIGLLLWAAS
jgi:Transglutaminase-like superfamily